MARELGLSKDDAERKPRAKPKPKAKAAAGAGGGPGRKRRVSNATTGVEPMLWFVPNDRSCPCRNELSGLYLHKVFKGHISVCNDCSDL